MPPSIRVKLGRADGVDAKNSTIMTDIIMGGWAIMTDIIMGGWEKELRQPSFQRKKVAKLTVVDSISCTF